MKLPIEKSPVYHILVQKRLRRERRTRKRLHDQLEIEAKRRAQLEDALRAAGAPEQISIINVTMAQVAYRGKIGYFYIPDR
ncbi:hypothetical protein NQ318_007388 [Aromia moschata]|uniref:Uncharacterized protein n=1 Tax=Aromia moschata TaxID=1265417 RepID=A0AAV8YD69_9CUCU|nr:hypothetical protein NQ318_007388 [Aromia moschata]